LRHQNVFLLFCAISSCLSVAASASAGQAINIQFGPSSVTATGITPNGSAVFYSVGYTYTGYGAVLKKRAQVVTDTAGTGSVVLPLTTSIEKQSRWIVADLQTGEYAVADAYGDSVIAPKHARVLGRGSSGNIDHVLSEGWTADVLYVHPGKGAWTCDAIDGGRGDEDGEANFQSSVDLTRCESLIGNSGPFNAVVPGGLLFVIDEMDMTLFAERITTELLAGAR
jgi:hypothetical protein